MTDKFCKFCGTAHTETAFPLKCGNCKTMTWFSPSPVAVNLQPVQTSVGLGLLIGRRTIEPHKGGWNLIGGFVDAGDKDVQTAAAREMLEETGFVIDDPDAMDIVSTFSDGRHFLIFVENYNAFDESILKTFVPNDECDEIKVIYEPTKLCFNSHTEAMDNWFAAQDRDDRRDYGSLLDDEFT